MCFDDLNEIFHAQLDVNALAVDEESRNRINLRVLTTLHIAKYSVLQLGRAQTLHEFVAVEPHLTRQRDEYRFRVRAVGPLSLVFEKGVVHLPVSALLARSFCCFGCQHGVRMNTDEREVVAFQAQFLRIPVQDFLDQRMIRSAARALVISKLNQRQRRVFRAAEMTAAFDVGMSRRRSRFRLVGLTTQVNGSARSDSYSEEDYN